MAGKFDPDQIKQSVNIADVIGSYVDLRKNGSEYLGLCPFHSEKTPSFHVVPDKNMFHCFGCGANGDVIDFLQDHCGTSFREACEALGGEQLPDGKYIAKRAAKERHDPYADYVPEATTEEISGPVDLINPKRDGKVWRNASPLLVHPYRHADGSLHGYVLRLEIDGKKLTPQVRRTQHGWTFYPFDEPRPIYGLETLDNENQTIIVEGEKAADAARAVLRQINVISWAGGTNGVSKTDWSPLKGRSVVIIPDRDDPGLKAARDVGDLIDSEHIKYVLPPSDLPKGWDVADRVWSSGRELLEWCRENVVAELPTTYDVPADESPEPEAGDPGWTPDDACEPEPLPPATAKPKPNLTVAYDWREQLIYKDKGEGLKASSIKNAELLLSHHDDIRGVFAYNYFTKKIDVMREPPWPCEPSEYPREVMDVDETRCCGWLETHGLSLSLSVVHNAISAAAHRNIYNPVQDYLNGLEWDRIERLDHWLQDTFDAPDDDYVRSVGRRFLIGAVARAMQNGCKMDNMLILEGKQGIRKSMAVEALFGADWFTDELDDLGSKDAAMQIQGVWCVEMAELTTLSRAEANRIKEWLTRREDRFRPPYGRNVISAPRQCVIVGTVNPEGGYLKDATGGRRFWPVRCFTVNIEHITRIRNQLWAEAVQAWRNGERWWFEEDELVLAQQEQEERYESDPWEERIANFIELEMSVSVMDVMNGCLSLPSYQQNQLTQNRVAKILTSLGWKRIQKRVGGKRRWVYINSPDEEN